MNDNGKITVSFRDGLNMPILKLKTIGGSRNPWKSPNSRCLQNNPPQPPLADPSKWPLISIDDKQSQMTFAMQLLQNRLDRINEAKNEDINVIPLLEIEKTYLLFQNAHFKPFAEIGYQYDKLNTIPCMEVTDEEQQRGRGLYQIIANDGYPRRSEKAKKISERRKASLNKQTVHRIKISNKIKEQRQKNTILQKNELRSVISFLF